MARLICPNTGLTVDVPSDEAAAKLQAAGYRPEPKPKAAPRKRTAKPKTQGE